MQKAAMKENLAKRVNSSFFPKKVLTLKPVGEEKEITGVSLYEREFRKDYPFIWDNVKYVVPKTKNFKELYKIDEDVLLQKQEIKYIVPLDTLQGTPLVEEKKVEEAEPQPVHVSINEKPTVQEAPPAPAKLEWREEDDITMSKMTLRHYACVHLGVPASGLKWLDDIINAKNQR